MIVHVVLYRVSYQNTSLFRNLAKYTNIPHVCCPNFDSIPIYLILGVRYTNIPHVFWKFQQYTNIPHAWFGRAKRAYQYTSCFRKMAKYTNIPQFSEYQETITSPLLYRYLPYIICAQCMNNVIWIFLVSTWNCRVKLIEILSVPAVPWYHTLLGYSTSRDWNLGVTRDYPLASSIVCWLISGCVCCWSVNWAFGTVCAGREVGAGSTEAP